MLNKTFPSLRWLSGPLLGASAVTSLTASTVELAPYTVLAPLPAVLEPAGGVAQTVSALRAEARVDLQSRGAPEQQGDVTLRGGTFEQTGFALGALPVFDPQTGHYFGELPFDPQMLSAATIELGVANAIDGFNSAVGTIRYGWAPVMAGGLAEAGVGTDQLNFQRVYLAVGGGDSPWGGDVSYARSEADGTIDFGEHDFERISVRLQHRSEAGDQTDVFAGYSDEFYGWPGMYTGFSTLNEFDHYQIGVIGINHRRGRVGERFLEAGLLYRTLTDTYDFIRGRELAPGERGPFDHATQVWTGAVRGEAPLVGAQWRYNATVVVDELVRSTALTNGPFTERAYAKVSLAPEWSLADADGTRWRYGVGVTLDVSDRDDTHVAPQAWVDWLAADPAWGRFRVEYSEATQVPGYTVLASNPVGLFGGNPTLGSEVARAVELAWQGIYGDVTVGVNVFHRWDEDLIDWTFSTASSSARQANPLDGETIGAEAVVIATWDTLRVGVSYTFLDKDADYGDAAVDASYYALNYAEHRATLNLAWTPLAGLTLRTDVEARRQADNPLRTTGRDAFLVFAALDWQPAFAPAWTLSALVDNATEDDFQDFPGTPAAGRQLSLRARLDW